MASRTVGALNVKITADTSGIEKGFKKTQKGLKNTTNSLTRSQKRFKEWSTTSTVATVALSAAVALTARKVIQMADTFTSLQNQIRQTTSTTQELTDRTQQLLDVANRSRVEFSATAELYTKLSLSTKELNLSSDELVRITETIGKSFAASGASAQESAGAIRQLGQAFSAGALRGDEFNSIAEGAPEIMRALQRSLNLTQGELRKLAAEGGITSEILVKALTEAAEVIDEKLSGATRTLAQSFQEAENNAIAFVGTNETMKESMKNSGDAIVFLSENLDTLVSVVLIAAAVGMTKLSAAIIMNTIETVKNTAVKIATVPVTKALNTGISFTTRAVVVQTAAMRASTVAATGLKTSMAFLGGPVGVAILAGLAILAYSDDAETARETSSRLSKEVDTLAASFQNLSDGQRARKVQNNIAKLSGLNKELTETVRALATQYGVASDEAIPTGTMAIINQNEEVIALTKSMNELGVANEALITGNIRQDVLSGGEEGTGDKDGVKDVIDEEELKREKRNDAFARRFQDIQDQNAKLKEQREIDAQQQLDDFEKQTATSFELENILHQEDLERAKEAFDTLRTTKAEQALILEDLETRHQQELTNIEAQAQSVRNQGLSNALDAAASLLAHGGKRAFMIMKGLAIASAIIKGQEAGVAAFAAGMSTGGPPGAAAALAMSQITTGLQIASIIASGIGNRSPSRGGGGGGSSAQSAPAAPQAQQTQSNRIITAQFVGQGNMSMEAVRQLIEQFNEALGDGATLNVTGG